MWSVFVFKPPTAEISVYSLLLGWGKATCIICYGTSMETLHGIRHHKCKYSLELMMSSFYICCCFSGENVKGHEKIWGKNNPWLTSQKYHRSYLYERQANSKGMVSSSYPTFPKLRSRVCQFPPHSGEKAAWNQREQKVCKRGVCPGARFAAVTKFLRDSWEPDKINMSCYLGVGDRLRVTERVTSCTWLGKFPCFLWLTRISSY